MMMLIVSKLTTSALFNIMNELILENIYEELLDELTQTNTLSMYSEAELTQEVYNRFFDRQ